jgi:hypothetical protein
MQKSLHHCITASLHHCITASLHHCITASLHHCITASLRELNHQREELHAGGLSVADERPIGHERRAFSAAVRE